MLAVAKNWFNLLLAVYTLLGCGNNMFHPVDSSKDPLAEASRALEKQQPTLAKEILLAELGSEVEDALAAEPDAALSLTVYELVAAKDRYVDYLSVLSAAYAQGAGVDPIDMVLNMAKSPESGSEGSENSSQGGNGITELFPILPAATLATIADTDRALYLLQAIPQAERDASDLFKLSLLLTSSFTLKLKILDLDGDGVISLEESLAISPESAALVLGSLTNAIATMSGYTAENTENASATKTLEKLQGIQGEISAQGGEDEAQNLADYLTAQP